VPKIICKQREGYNLKRGGGRRGAMGRMEGESEGREQGEGWREEQMEE